MTNKLKENQAKITNIIIEQLENLTEADKKNFKMPWHTIGLAPTNAVTGNKYNGINELLLLICNPYQSNLFAGFGQWSGKGCKIKAKSKGFKIARPIIISKEIENEDKDTGEVTKEEVRFVANFKIETVFNSEQVEGEFAREVEALAAGEASSNNERIEAAQGLVENYLANELIKTIIGPQPSYSPLNDKIEMPTINHFNTSEDFYSVYLHEITHSTGHEKRLKRNLLDGAFNREKYAKEELIAELGAAFLCAEVGIKSTGRKDHAKYLNSWLSVLRNDKAFIFQAASKAQKACDYVLEAAENYEEFLNKKQSA
jgi:antirestriction protein ArdC